MGSPAQVAITRRAWIAAIAASASTFVFVVDSGLLSIAFPKLQEAFPATDRGTLSWAFTGFSVVMAALMAFAGNLADRVGRKRVYLGGLTVYGVGAIGTATAPTVSVLIVSRLVQGAGAAFFVTSALALMLIEFPVERRGAALGLWGVVGSLGAILAPTVGAEILDRWSWRWAFGALAVLALASVFAGRVLVDSRNETATAAPDTASVLIGAGGVALVMLAISRGSTWGWSSPLTWLVLVVGLALLPLVVRRSRTRPRPLIPPLLMQERPYRLLTLACVVQQVGFFGYFFALPIILTGVWHWTVLQAGYAMALSMAVSAVVVVFAARFADAHGYTGLILVGAAITAGSAVWWIVTMRVEPDVWLALGPGLVLQGIGSSIVGNLTTAFALRHVPVELMGSANSLHQMSRRVGGALGVALTVALLGTSQDPAELLDGARRSWGLLILVHVVMAGLVAMVGHRSAATEASARPVERTG
jgi:EmrB/QacA subfamily drug resistance transporter